MVAGTFLMPLTLPPLVLGLIGLDLATGIWPLMRNLAFFVGGAALAAVALRGLLGATRLGRHRIELSGLNVLFLLLFAIGIMDGIGTLLVEHPGQVLLYASVALLASLALQLLSFLVFAWQPASRRSPSRSSAATTTMAVVWATLGSTATPELTLFFAAVQLPIYVLPAALKPIYSRLGAARPLAAD